MSEPPNVMPTGPTMNRIPGWGAFLQGIVVGIIVFHPDMVPWIRWLAVSAIVVLACADVVLWYYQQKLAQLYALSNEPEETDRL